MKQWYHSSIAGFLWKTVVIYLIWYSLYELWLLPQGSLDHRLTTNIVSVSSAILDFFNFTHFANGRIIGLQNTAGLHLVDGCSGISAMGLFVGFIIAYPGKWNHRVYFISFGILVLYAVNIIRIVALSIVQSRLPAIFDVMHDYSTTAIFYIVIFVLWMVWANLNHYLTTKTAVQPKPVKNEA